MEALEILNRSEMKMIKAGYMSECDGNYVSGCACTYNGCDVYLTQCTGGWHISSCSGEWSGSGSYGGSTCGGVC